MNMKEELQHNLKELNVSKNSKFILAVSGGVDSMVLLDIFHSARLNFVVAHCNFGLRGQDSDRDQELVTSICEVKGIKCFVKQIALDQYKKTAGVSTQMAARDLRYSWFQELMALHPCDFLVTGHHLNDSIETALLNIARGTGIEGIKGIPMISNDLFRPLINTSKSELRKYAKVNQVLYREDKSNSSNDYKRNKMRNEVLPILEEINPGFVGTMKNNLSHFNEAFEFYKISMDTMIASVSEADDKGLSIRWKELLVYHNPSLVLFEATKSFGFDRAQANDILVALTKNHYVGKEFFSQTHRLLIDRTLIFVQRIEEQKNEIITINNQNKVVTFGVKLTFNQFPKGDFDLLTDSKFAFLDADKLTYPLELRKWKEGDKFQPLGMFGKKKVSDFLIDEKVSKIEKEKTWVLLSGDRICWLVGHRVDDSFKLTQSTKTVLKITFDSN